MTRLPSIALAALLAIAPLPALAQAIGGNASISVTGTSGRVALPSANKAQYPFVFLVPGVGAGTQEIFYKFGDVTVVATTGSPALPANGICVNVGPGTYIAAITATSTATLRITQLSTCP